MCRAELTAFETQVAKRIQARRQDLGISVTKMIEHLAAQNLKVAIPTYYQWEKAIRPISLANLATIATVLNTDIENLITTTPAKKKKK